MPLLRGSVLPSLVKLGLTQNQALAYQALCQHGPQSANQLAKQLDILPNACYRLDKDLERSNLITISNSHPQVFTAINPSIALTSFIQKHQTDLDKLQTLAVNELAFKPPTSETQVDFLEHKNLFFNTYVKLANKAQEEILIISIGESVTDDILIANRDAIERGVSIKMIAHKYDHENQQLLKNHLKMGLLVRHLPQSKLSP